MTTLVIVESPAKAKTIKKYLGKGYEVKASVGHVRDLPKSNAKAIDIDGGFVPNYEISPEKKAVIEELRKAAKKADEILLATDPDREGEAIAWHVAEILAKSTKVKPKRVVFHEITEPAVKEAIAHPRHIDDNLRRAQEARRVLDRLVGYDLSGLIWKKVRYGLSAGRVQSPALRIIMERERQIRAFIPEKFWVITANTRTPNKHSLLLTCVEEPRDKTETDRILAVGEKASWHVAEVKESEQKRVPRPPFTTSTIQQTASTRLGFSPSRTMRAAQKLYEAGHITYMRTDSTSMSTIAQQQIIALVKSDFGDTYLQPRVYKTKSKSAQEAHEAVRPTNFAVRDAGATDDEQNLYRLIWQRAVSSQMSDARLQKTRITAEATPASGDKAIPSFTANGSRIVFDGWLRVDQAARGEDVELPLVHEGETLDLQKIDAEGKETQPPSRYTEAGLIKELEKRGIGRPSTYASIMNTIVTRGYVEKQGRTLIPTDVGDVVSTFLEAHFTDYISDTFTSDMETELDDIAEGKREYEKTLREFYGPFHAAVESKADIEKLTTLGDGPKEFPCPLCGSAMVYKLGKGGKFLSCARFPDCTGSRLADGTEIKADEPIGTDPESGKPIFVLSGRFGPYVQVGETPDKKDKTAEKPRRASIPKEKDVSSITLADALHYLALPRTLGNHPDTGEPIVANVGRFGPYIAYAGDFRSLKGADNPYDITLERALEIVKEPKKGRAGEKIIREVGLHPKTKRMIRIYESKSGRFLKKGFKRIMLPSDMDPETLTPADAAAMLK